MHACTHASTSARISLICFVFSKDGTPECEVPRDLAGGGGDDKKSPEDPNDKDKGHRRVRKSLRKIRKRNVAARGMTLKTTRPLVGRAVKLMTKKWNMVKTIGYQVNH